LIVDTIKSKNNMGKPYDLKTQARGLMGAAIRKEGTVHKKNQSLHDILEKGVNLSTAEAFNGFAKEIGIDISNPETQVEVNENNFIKLQGEATIIRTLQIRLLNAGNIENIKAFEASNLYKKCKAIEAGLEDFKARNFGEIPNFSGSLTSDDLEVGSDEAKINGIQEKIKSATAKLVEENTLKSLELNKGNRDKVAMMALNSNPIGLALINNSENGIELMKQTPFDMKTARFGATLGLLCATGLVSGLVFGLIVPCTTVVLGGTTIAGIIATTLGGITMGTVNLAGSKIGKKIDNIGIVKEDNPEKQARADSIERIGISNELCSSFCKELQKYGKNLSGNNKTMSL